MFLPSPEDRRIWDLIEVAKYDDPDKITDPAFRLLAHIKRDLAKTTRKMLKAVSPVFDVETGQKIGTGFFYYSKSKKCYFVTAKHIFLHHFKAKFRVEFRPGDLDVIHVDVPAPETLEFAYEDVIQHPSEDLAATHLTDKLPEPRKERGVLVKGAIAFEFRDLNLFSRNHLLNYASPNEQVVMFGYPMSFADELNHLPILRNGCTAISPWLDFQKQPRGITNIACYPGDSGAPICMLNNIFCQGLLGIHIEGRTTWSHLGMDAPPDSDIEPEQGMAIGIYLKASLLQDIDHWDAKLTFTEDELSQARIRKERQERKKLLKHFETYMFKAVTPIFHNEAKIGSGFIFRSDCNRHYLVTLNKLLQLDEPPNPFIVNCYPMSEDMNEFSHFKQLAFRIEDVTKYEDVAIAKLNVPNLEDLEIHAIDSKLIVDPALLEEYAEPCQSVVIYYTAGSSNLAVSRLGSTARPAWLNDAKSLVDLPRSFDLELLGAPIVITKHKDSACIGLLGIVTGFDSGVCLYLKATFLKNIEN